MLRLDVVREWLVEVLIVLGVILDWRKTMC